MTTEDPSGALAENLAVWGAPVFEELGLDLYDVELASGRLLVTVDKPGGVGLDEIARCTRALSPILDDHDPIAGHYTLEVSSPGLERRLRTIAHRRAAVGETVKCKFRDADGSAHRVEGVLGDVDDDAFVVQSDDGPVRVDHDAVTSVRTVFVWPAPRTAKGGRPRGDRAGSTPATTSDTATADHVREATP